MAWCEAGSSSARRGRGKPWSYVVDVGVGANGKRRQRLKGGFHTRAEAEKALAELLVQVDRGLAVDPSRQTLGEYLDDWLAAVVPSLRPTTASAEPVCAVRTVRQATYLYRAVLVSVLIVGSSSAQQCL